MRNRRLFIFNNLFITITGVLAIIVTLTIGSRAARLGGGPMTAHYQQICTFTVLSNLFLSCVAVFAVVMTAYRLPLTRALLNWYLAAATATTVTLLTVLLYLAPLHAAAGHSYFDMLLEPMFFLHFLNPLLADFNFIFFSGTHPIHLGSRLLATLPVVFYAIPYTIFVFILKSWPDFYGLTFGGRYRLCPLIIFAFCLFALTSASLLTFLRHFRIDHQAKSSHHAQNMLK